MRLIIFFMLLSLSATSQLKDSGTLKLKYDSFYFKVRASSPYIERLFSFIWVDKEFRGQIDLRMDSSIAIEGDTLELLRRFMINVFEDSKRRTQEMKDKQEIIDAAVDYINQLPNQYKTEAGNCKWPRYWAVLKKNGYKTRAVSKTDCE